jgi:hypothetical protein
MCYFQGVPRFNARVKEHSGRRSIQLAAGCWLLAAGCWLLPFRYNPPYFFRAAFNSVCSLDTRVGVAHANHILVRALAAVPCSSSTRLASSAPDFRLLRHVSAFVAFVAC